MIHIRYKTLSPGRHAEAARGTKGVVVYLVPGLTGDQRRAALRRLRQEGSRGCGPELPSVQLGIALAVDWLRVGVGNTGAVVRRHPVGTLLPALLAAGLLAAFVLASVSVRPVPEVAPGPSSVVPGARVVPGAVVTSGNGVAPGSGVAPGVGGGARWPASVPARVRDRPAPAGTARADTGPARQN